MIELPQLARYFIYRYPEFIASGNRFYRNRRRSRPPPLDNQTRITLLVNRPEVGIF